MANDWNALHCTFLNNCTLGMYGWLGNHLGVTTDTLMALQIGYAPRVLFGGKGLKKEHVSYDGWFTVPMRDENAKLMGFSLRNCNGKKLMYPGSKPGCMYVVNPKHREGEHGYSSGSHNWVRVGAGVDCPVCSHGDGCLVSSECPSDPKAVVCVRTPSPAKLKLGWLHIRKDTGILASASALADHENPVLVVEGMSDVAAAYDLGFPAIGKPNNIGGQEIMAELVRGRTVIVMGENDKKANGEWPGAIGASMSLKAALTTTGKVRTLFPPEHIKDLRAWKNNFGLTAAQLLADAEEKGQEQITQDLIEDDRPLTIFRRFLQEKHSAGKVTLLKNWEESWYVYDPAAGCYTVIDENALIGEFARWTMDKQVIMERSQGPKPEKLKFTAGLWASMRQVALADGYLHGSLPQWINGKNGLDMHSLICFNNGILDVDAYLENSAVALLPSTPDLFTVNALPFAFDPTAECSLWKQFLDSSLGDDPAKVLLLQEWLGYCMTADISMEKLLYMRGPTGHGKGTILNVISHLVGKRNVASPQFKKLADNFGLASLVGKLVCLIGDARDDRAGATMAQALEVLLSISGGDELQIDRKFLTRLEGVKLMTRITIASNIFLNIPDPSGAMERRLMILDFQKKVTEEQRDHTLKQRLVAEVPGIAAWALEGLRRLRLNGRFTVPESSEEAMQEWKLFNNPLASFLDECTVQRANEFITRRMLYDGWEKWTAARRLPVGTKSQFFNDILTLATYVSQEGKDESGKNELIYRGLMFTPDAARRYVGRP